MGLLGKISDLLYRLILGSRARYQKSCFSECGKDVFVGQGCDFIPSHIHCGNHVHIGSHCSFIASIAHIYIGDYVLFGPHVTIRGGDHRMDVIGKHIYEVKESEKLPENDANVYIEDGVWIGCNVTILKGVTVGKGSVVAAGAVVTKSIPPYCIAGGVPAKVIRKRFSDAQILEHESLLSSRGNSNGSPSI